MAPWFDGGGGEVVECWQRRYRCTVCGRITVVMPAGVMPRYLYSVGAILMAHFLVSCLPGLGLRLSAGAAYARQGMLRHGHFDRVAPYEWRSLGRWARLAIERWWPHASLDGLLIELWVRGGGSHAGALSQAVASQAQCGGSFASLEG